MQWKSGALREQDQGEIQILRTLMMHDRRNPSLIREYLQTLTERPHTPLPHGRILAMATHHSIAGKAFNHGNRHHR